jgi:hypothetical protein
MRCKPHPSSSRCSSPPKVRRRRATSARRARVPRHSPQALGEPLWQVPPGSQRGGQCLPLATGVAVAMTRDLLGGICLPSVTMSLPGDTSATNEHARCAQIASRPRLVGSRELVRGDAVHWEWSCRLTPTTPGIRDGAAGFAVGGRRGGWLCCGWTAWRLALLWVDGVAAGSAVGGRRGGWPRSGVGSRSSTRRWRSA